VTNAHVIIGGRTVADYYQCGARIEAGYAILPCVGCRQRVVISPNGKRRLDEARRSSLSGSVICSRCLLLLPFVDEVHVSPHAAGQAAASPSAQYTLDRLREHLSRRTSA